MTRIGLAIALAATVFAGCVTEAAAQRRGDRMQDGTVGRTVSGSTCTPYVNACNDFCRANPGFARCPDDCRARANQCSAQRCWPTRRGCLPLGSMWNPYQ